MTTSYLCLERTKTRTRLLILDQEALDRYCSVSVTPYRISPIFPVLPGKARLPNNRTRYQITFFILDKPYSAIAGLLKVLPLKHQGSLWFSHGLCSLLVISKDGHLPERVRTLAAGSIVRALETWKVDHSKVERKNLFLERPVPFDQADFELDYAGFPSDVTAVIWELIHSLNTAVRRSAQFAPEQLEGFRRLAQALRDILLDLRFLHGIGSASPKSFSADAVKEILKNPVQRQKLIHQRIGNLVQVNSALSYQISQAFAGTVPLFESDCHIRAFSLLGIGSACRALAAFSRFTESIFQDNPVDEVISKRFSIPQALRVQTNPMNHHLDAKSWDNKQWSVDAHVKEVGPIKKKFNLVYFSGRLGFREAEFSITAALQVLTNAGTAPWSIMTFTHEMIHGHVRGLLATIFYDASKRFRLGTYGEIFEKFVDYLNQSPRTRLPDNFIQSLQFQILAYCGNHRVLRIALEEQSRTGQMKLNVKGSWEKRELESEFTLCNREINEIFVHVLDYNYFYNGNARTYLSLLWQSWLPVPVVLDDVQNYVWRSLVALASQHAGDANTRFETARKIFIRALSQMKKAGNDNVLIRRAITCLKTKRDSDVILFRFQFALPLVDMIQKFLCSSHIHAALFEDDNAQKTDDGYLYALETGKFDKVTLVSPIALAADRLRRALIGEKTSFEDSHVAAWFFLACSECESKKGTI